MATELTSRDLRQQVADVPFWWHSIDLGSGIVTPGRKTPKILDAELARSRLPDLHGRSVLDIGAWDGYFSFQAERLGARRVVALDHFVWSIDWAQKAAKGRSTSTSSNTQSPDQDVRIWRPAELPGKRGFDLAHEALQSSVESIVDDYMTCDLEALGQFDVVFYLGVLYHMRHPLLALERLARLTREMAVIETEAVWVADENRAWCEFFESNELGDDPTNWWAPNEQALIGMCRAAGFRRVEILCKPSFPRRWFSRFKPRRYRLVAHAYK
jgi:tRNA (mo5U34)-methyltransferase